MIHQAGSEPAPLLSSFVTRTRVIPYRIVNRAVGCDRSALTRLAYRPLVTADDGYSITSSAMASSVGGISRPSGSQGATSGQVACNRLMGSMLGRRVLR